MIVIDDETFESDGSGGASRSCQHNLSSSSKSHKFKYLQASRFANSFVEFGNVQMHSNIPLLQFFSVVVAMLAMVITCVLSAHFFAFDFFYLGCS